MKILFVQSDRHWRTKLQHIFKSIGYNDKQVQFCSSPRRAVGRVIRKISYDLIMIDYGWSVDGLVKQIRQRNPDIQVVCYSKSSDVVLPRDVDRELIYKDTDVIIQRVRKHQQNLRVVRC